MGDRIVVEYLKQWWRLFDEEATRGGGENFDQPLQLLEDKQHFGGEDCNIPKIYILAKWNIIDYLVTR